MPGWIFVTDFAAGPSTPTCRNCTGGNCDDNLLPELLQQALLTSGYFNVFSPAKPAGNFMRSSVKDVCI